MSMSSTRFDLADTRGTGRNSQIDTFVSRRYGTHFTRAGAAGFLAVVFLGLSVSWSHSAILGLERPL